MQRFAVGKHARRLCMLPVAAVVTLGVAAAVAAPSAVTTAAAGRGVSAHMVPAVGLHPLAVEVGKTDGLRFSCQPVTAPVRCYTPQQLDVAYGWDSFHNRGAGETVVIIDAYQSPTLLQDVQLEDSTFHLPPPKLTVVAPDGLTPFNPKNPAMVGWSLEISLDVESVHNYVPDAKIVLVLARSESNSDIFLAQKYAIDHDLGDVLSQSFGEAERCEAPGLLHATHELFVKAAGEGMSVFASSGDTGAAQPNCAGTRLILSASTPASDPDVTGVGGTNVFLTDSGHWIGETAWNDGFGESGGGLSTVFKTPSYQKGLHLPVRAVPDVSYNAGVNGGILIYWGSSGEGTGLLWIVGGTSAGSPAWASLAALADQKAGHRLGLLNHAIYSIAESSSYSSDFHDITIGNNIESVGGYYTAPGYDLVTGWGTPQVNSIVPALVAAG
jgi:subtilase family serine protease